MSAEYHWISTIMKERVLIRMSAEYHGISTIMKEWVLIRMSAEYHRDRYHNEETRKSVESTFMIHENPRDTPRTSV